MKVSTIILVFSIALANCRRAEMVLVHELKPLGIDTLNTYHLELYISGDLKDTIADWRNHIYKIQFANNAEFWIDTIGYGLKPSWPGYSTYVCCPDFKIRYMGKVPLLHIDSLKEIRYGPDTSYFHTHLLFAMSKELINTQVFEVRRVVDDSVYHSVVAGNVKPMIWVSYRNKQGPEIAVKAFNHFAVDTVLGKQIFQYSPH